MGSNPRAHLAYGYDLGSYEDFKAAERGEWGSPALPWLDEDASTYAFGDAAEKLLTDHAGVRLDYSGADESVGWMLVVDHSARNVEWSDAMTLNVTELECRPAEEGWDDKLDAALTALGITPAQTAAQWLVYPTYG
jgi:hypothetical protein